MYIEEALNIIKKDTDIFLKIPYKNDYIYIAYSKEDNFFSIIMNLEKIIANLKMDTITYY